MRYVLQCEECNRPGPARHGKSRTASMFAKFVFGQNQSENIMTGSYNKMLSITFSKAVRNDISEGRRSMIQFTVPGTVQAQERPRFSRMGKCVRTHDAPKSRN